MGAHYVCDYCGEPIDSERSCAHIFVMGGRFKPRVYHDTTCVRAVEDILDGAGEQASPRENPSRPRDKLQAWREEWEASRCGWTQLALSQRERLVIETIGEGKLSVREIVAQWSDRPDLSNLHYSDVYPTVRALYEAGELDRSLGRVKGTRRTCQHYFRKDMSGPIADLERTFHEQGEEA